MGFGTHRYFARASIIRPNIRLFFAFTVQWRMALQKGFGGECEEPKSGPPREVRRRQGLPGTLSIGDPELEEYLNHQNDGRSHYLGTDHF
jgi:hypothetical protein